MAATTNQRLVELIFNRQNFCSLLADLVYNRLDGGLSCSDSLLSPAAGDSCLIPVLSLIQVNGSVGIILDLVNYSTTFTKNARDRTGRNGEFDDVVGLLFEFCGVEKLRFRAGNTLFPTLDEHLVWLEIFARPTLRPFGYRTWERDLDIVLILEPDNILATVAD